MSTFIEPDLLSEITIIPDAWVGVNLDYFEHNISKVQKRLSPQTKLCAVVKADAYGLGVENIMPSIVRAGVPYVGIASNSDALCARKNGFTGSILRVRPATPKEHELTVPLGIEELVGNLDSAIRLSDMACASGQHINVHLSLNSKGLSRDGLEVDKIEGQRCVSDICALPGIKIVGVMTHFADYENQKMAVSLRQFEDDIAWLLANTNLKRDDILLHAAHSYSLLELPESHLDMVRTGAALVGCVGKEPAFECVMSLRSQVAVVTRFSKGNFVGYDRTKILERDSLLANIPLGYSNGYSRAFSNRGDVLIRGHRAPIMGKVSMNSIVVDVTEIANVIAGDEVILFGKQSNEEISQAEIEKNSGTILADNYTSWGRANVRRVYRGD